MTQILLEIRITKNNYFERYIISRRHHHRHRLHGLGHAWSVLSS
jgi:hypothetical protein